MENITSIPPLPHTNSVVDGRREPKHACVTVDGRS